MKKRLGAILIAGTTVLGAVQVAQAGGATDAALGLGAFAVFNQFVRGETVFHSFFGRPTPVIVQQPVVVAPPPPVVYAPPPQPVVYYAPPPPVVYAPAPAPVYYGPQYFHGPRYVYGPRYVQYAPHYVHNRVPPGHYRKHYRHD